MRIQAILFVLALSLIFIACGSRSEVPHQSTTDDATASAANDQDHSACIGHLRHRGRDFCLTNLTDSEFVARSDDPFVKNFEQQTIMADARGFIEAQSFELSPIDIGR